MKFKYDVYEAYLMSKEKLALKGGKPVREKPIPQPHRGYGWQFIGEEEKKSVFEALDDRLAGSPRGPRVRRLEKEFASVIGTKYALGCVNGCLSELMITAASGIGPGDEVIVPAFTWWAPAQTTLAANAMPIIAEVDDTLNLDPADFEAKITKRTKAVWVVDMVGAQARMDEIMEIAEKRNILVFEDVAQCVGGSYKGKRLGSIGNAGSFSLQHSKVITTGEGGIVTTNDEELLRHMLMFHDPSYKDFSVGTVKFREGEIPITGINCRMNELVAAMALAQLPKMDKILQRARENKRRVMKGIEGLGLNFRHIPDPEGEVAMNVTFFLPTARKAQEYAKALQAENIDAGVYYVPGVTTKDLHIYSCWDTIMHKKTISATGCPYTCPFYVRAGGREGGPEYSKDMCPRTLDLLSRAVSVPLGPLLSKADVESIIEGIRKVTKALL
jgi:8-amino-3,8-dideoxy-alpha-D-manno-octulosonate transaminase